MARQPQGGGRSPTWRPADAAALAELAREIRQRVPLPMDSLEVAAVLESIGHTDESAGERYDAPNLFVLAEAVLARLQSEARELPTKSQTDVTAPRSIRQVLSDLAFGPLALFPGVVCLLIISAFATFGNWAHGQVFALSLGFTVSMLITGGFIHAIGRRMSLYLGIGRTSVAGQYLGLSAGFAACGVVVIALLIYAATRWLNLGTIGERTTLTLAFVGLAMIWLLAAGLCLIREPVWLGIGLSGGLVAGIIADRLTAPFTEAHLAIGSLTGFAVAVAIVGRRLHWAFGGLFTRTKRRAALPAGAYLVSEAMPYFGYGVLGMAFVVAPHVLGWSGALDADQTRDSAIATLETGVMMALAPIILAGGVAEHALRRLWEHMAHYQRTIVAGSAKQFGEALGQFYATHLSRYLTSLAAMSVLAYAGFRLALEGDLLTSWVAAPDRSTLVFICQFSLIACYFLGWGFFNCMVVNTLARPGIALRAIAAGLLVTALLGLWLSLGIHFSYAIAAFVVGAGVFAWLSGHAIERLLKSADYHYFASF